MGSVAENERENMFLLEVLVDRVTIDNNRLDFDQETVKNLGEACVMFQFLNYPPLVVCHEDFGKRTSHYGATTDIVFNSGKSCLFSFRPQQMSIPEPFQIQVSVLRRVMSRHGGTGKKTIATANIDLGEDFATLMRRSRISVVESSTPLCQAKGDTYALQNLNETVVGEIKVFLRLSCFGQYIVTQFSMGGKDDHTYLFKGTERSEISKVPGDKTKRPIPQIDASRPCPPPLPHQEQVPSKVPSTREDKISRKGSVTRPEPTTRPVRMVDKPRGSMPYDGDSQRLSQEFRPYIATRSEMVEREMAKELGGILLATLLPPAQPQPPTPPPTPATGRQTPVPAEPEGSYKEITAEVKGHTIRIRVPRGKKDGAIKRHDGLGPVCKYAPKLNVCDCNYPIPPELIPRCPVPQQPPHCGCR